MTNPIFEKYFKNAAIITSKTFGNARSIVFRKQLAMWNLIQSSKPANTPNCQLVERRGDKSVHHMFWLKDEGCAMRASQAWKGRKRAPNYNARIDKEVGTYVAELEDALKGLQVKAATTNH